MEEVVIVSGVRLANGKFLGGLKSLSAPKMGALVIKEALERVNFDAKELDEVVMANIHQAGVRPNPARQAAIMAGVPVEVPSFTTNKLCGSGLKALEHAWMSILTDQAQAIMVAGSESMSNVPYLVLNARDGYKMGSQKLEDSLFYDGFEDPFTGELMGMTAENVAERFGICREEQDEFAYNSHIKALKAIEEGKFKSEILPVEIKERKKTYVVDTDECPRNDISLEKLSKLRTAFKKDGTVTAGNACGLSDSAGALLVMSKTKAMKMGLPIMATIKAFASVGLDPAIMGFAPALAVKKLMQKTNMKIAEIDLMELNEAFASQSLAVIRDLGISMDKVNVNGGAIALGHPVGQSGIRLVLTLVRELKERDLKKGVATLCIGGGMGIAVLVER